MSLNWNISKVKDFEKLYTQKDEEGKTKLKKVPETIIYLTTIVGMGEITDKNWEQFYNRVNFIEKLGGTFLLKQYRKKPIPRFITEDDVKQMIGLTTNASTMTQAQFLKRHTQYLGL